MDILWRKIANLYLKRYVRKTFGDDVNINIIDLKLTRIGEGVNADLHIRVESKDDSILSLIKRGL